MALPPFDENTFKSVFLPMSEGNRFPPPTLNCLFPVITIKNIERSPGKWHIIVPLDAGEKRVPNNSRCLGKSQTIMKLSDTQLSSYISPKAVRLSFAGSRLSLTICVSLFSMGTVLLQGTVTRSWCITK